MSDPGRAETDETTDDLDDLLRERVGDPAFRGHYEDAERRARLLRSLLTARQAAGLSQAAVASTMRTTQSAVSELETGSTDPRLSTLQRYARAVLHVHVAADFAHPLVGPEPMLSGVSFVSSAETVPTWFAGTTIGTPPPLTGFAFPPGEEADATPDEDGELALAS